MNIESKVRDCLKGKFNNSHRCEFGAFGKLVKIDYFCLLNDGKGKIVRHDCPYAGALDNGYWKFLHTQYNRQVEGTPYRCTREEK